MTNDQITAALHHLQADGVLDRRLLAEALGAAQAELARYRAAGLADVLEGRAVVAPIKGRALHLKRGSEYVVLGDAGVQSAEAIHEGDTVVVYRGEDGRLCVRPLAEFNDGRFKVLP